MSRVRCLLAAALLLTLSWGCSKDCPVCPVDEDQPETPAYKGWLYYVEFGHDLFADLYMVDMEMDSIVDSLSYDQPGFGPGVVGVSGDGRFLALGYANIGATSTLTRIFDAQTLELIREFPYRFGSLFDNTDNLLIAAGYGTITVYDIPSFALVFSDTLSEFIGLVLDESNKRIYGSCDDLHLYTYDYANRRLADSIHIVPWPGDTALVYEFCLNRDFKRIYYRGLTNHGPHVGCYDVADRQVLWTYPTGTWYGDIAVSPDDREVYVTDPGGDIYPNSGTIYVFDAGSGDYLQGISLKGYLQWPLMALRGSEMVFSPTGEKLYVATGKPYGEGVPGSDISYGSVLVVDTKCKQIVKLLTPELDRWPQFMAIGPKL